jgi:hypothetical protein
MADFTKKAGQSGPPPAGKPGTTVNVVIPPEGSGLSCPGGYTVSVELSQQRSSCDSPDFNPLYDLVETIVDENIAPVTCPAPCRLETHILSQYWDCVLLAPNDTPTARVRLAKRAFCTETPIDFKFPSRPTRDDLRKKGDFGHDVGDSGIDRTHVHPLRIPACGGEPVAIRLEYAEPCDCDATSDFEPAVTRARARATNFACHIRCEAPCVPKVEDLQYSWDCDRNELRITVNFRVWCARPMKHH